MASGAETSNLSRRGGYSSLKIGAAALALGWTAIIITSLWWSLALERREEDNIAVSQGRAAFSRDLAFRRWNAMHGGVYTQVTKNHPPNPYLDVPEKVIKTPSGKVLTLTNPAYMMRQLYESPGIATDLPMGRITSLKPINPANRPDDWERAALLDFEKGVKEKYSEETVRGDAYMRYMRVLLVEKDCIKCHARQGYSEGQVRGGISILVPLSPIRKAEVPHIENVIAGHIVLLLLGYAGIALAFVMLGRRARERDSAALQLADSRRDLQALMDNLPGVAYKCRNDASWTMEIISSGCLSLTGYDPADFTGGNISYEQIIHEDDRAVVRREIDAAISSKSPFTIEYRINPAGGGTKWVIEQGSGVYDDTGALSCIEGIIIDDTPRKLGELALRSSEKRYRSFVSSFTGIAFRTKMDLTPVFYHGAVEEITGYKEDDFVSGRVSWVTLIHPDDRAAIRDSIAQIVAQAGNSFERVYRIVRRGGQSIWVREHMQVLFDESGEPEFLQGMIFDVSEKVKAELEVSESESRYRLLAESIPDVMYIVDREGTVTYSNSRNLPYDPVGRSQDDLFPLEIAEKHMAHIKAIFETGEPSAGEETLPSPLGGMVIENRFVPVKNSAGEVLSVLMITRDVTVARKTEAMLKTMLGCSFGDDLNAFMESLVHSIAEALNVKYVFAARISETGDSLEAFSFWDGSKFLPGMVYKITGTPCERVMDAGAGAYTKGVLSIFPDCGSLAALGAQCYLGAPLIDSLGGVWGVIAALDDKPFPEELVPNATAVLEIMAARTTAEYERHITAEGLRRSEARLRALSRNMISMREEDRRTLSRELHDELGQKLAALYLEIECLKTMPHAADSFVDAAKSILKNANDDLKKIYNRLRPIIIDKLGLGYALESLLREYREHSDMDITGDIAQFGKDEMDPDRAVAAYRILQEILANASKHSAARTINVRVRREGPMLRMTVQDDGVGFSPRAMLEGSGFGLMGMKERAEIYNGVFTVESSPGKGTITDVSIPLHDAGGNVLP